MKNDPKRKLTPALQCIILFGIVSLFSDMTHEAASSIRGVYYSLLGASAATIGFVSGLGELVGYSMRFIFGRLADRTRKYWPLTILGYVLDIVSVPLLTLLREDGWVFACMLLIVQRMGKAIKKPAKNTIISFAASQEGVGKSFGLEELLDQIGAFLGPVLLYLVMLFKTEGSAFEIYSFCFMILAIPGAITLFLLFFTKRRFPDPESFEPEPKADVSFRLSKGFCFYIAGISLFAFGFMDYSLILVHITRVFPSVSAGLGTAASLINTGSVPLLYALAMLVDAVSAMVFGALYDKHGFRALILSTILSAPFAVLVFLSGSVSGLFLGIAMWGIGMGAQESILKAAVTKFVPKQNRATGYGIFECSFGIFWFLGSWLLGTLYEISLPLTVSVSVLAQLTAIPLYILSDRNNGTLRRIQQ